VATSHVRVGSSSCVGVVGAEAEPARGQRGYESERVGTPRALGTNRRRTESGLPGVSGSARPGRSLFIPGRVAGDRCSGGLTRPRPGEQVARPEDAVEDRDRVACRVVLRCSASASSGVQRRRGSPQRSRPRVFSGLPGRVQVGARARRAGRRSGRTCRRTGAAGVSTRRPVVRSLRRARLKRAA
jgi:hypothetical protein